MVLLAVNDSVNADNPSFGYIDSILKNWKELGIDSPEALSIHKQKQEKEKNQQNSTQRVKSTTVKENFKSAPRDLDFLIE